jgi:hypothetical protein
MVDQNVVYGVCIHIGMVAAEWLPRWIYPVHNKTLTVSLAHRLIFRLIK